MNTNAASTTTETAAVAEQGAKTAPEQATSKGKAGKKKGAPKAQKTARKPAAKKAGKADAEKSAKPASKKTPKAKDAATPREGSKKQTVLLLLARKDGATMAEIADATGWQKHSIRGFISGAVTKKMGLVVESSKNEAGERVYRTK
jgi:hypothetical protein